MSTFLATPPAAVLVLALLFATALVVPQESALAAVLWAGCAAICDKKAGKVVTASSLGVYAFTLLRVAAPDGWRARLTLAMAGLAAGSPRAFIPALLVATTPAAPDWAVHWFTAALAVTLWAASLGECPEVVAVAAELRWAAKSLAWQIEWAACVRGPLPFFLSRARRAGNWTCSAAAGDPAVARACNWVYRSCDPPTIHEWNSAAERLGLRANDMSHELVLTGEKGECVFPVNFGRDTETVFVRNRGAIIGIRAPTLLERYDPLYYAAAAENAVRELGAGK